MARERGDVEALRRRIVEEATRLFAESGYGATSIQQIADAVGIGKTLVLYHFPSKEALRTEVLSAVTGTWEALLPVLVDSLDGGIGPPEAVLGAVVSFMRERPELPRFVLRELLEDRGEVGAWMRDRVGPATEAAAGLVQGSGEGDAYARVILAGLVLLGVLSVFRPGPDGALVGPTGETDGLGERVLAEAVRVVARALR